MAAIAQPTAVADAAAAAKAIYSEPLPKYYVAPVARCTGDQLAEYKFGEQYTGMGKDFVQKIRVSKTGVASRPPITVNEAFRKAAAKAADKVAMAVERPAGAFAGPEALPEGEWTTWTWKEYEEDADKAGAAFIALGANRHDSIGIWGFNSPEWLISCVAGCLVGSPPAGIYPTDTPDQVVYKLDHSETKVVVVEDEAKVARLTKVLDRVPLLKAIVVYRPSKEGNTPPLKRKDGSEVKVMTWSEMIQFGSEEIRARGGKAKIEAREKDVQPGSCAVLVYTSGTTGNPKAVMTSHDNACYEASCMFAHVPEIGGKPEQERTLSYLPLSHVAGFLLDIIIPVFSTAHMPAHFTTYFARPLDLKEGTIGKRLQFAKPTFFFGVPRVYEKMQEKIKAVGASNTGLKKMIGTWAKGRGLKKAQASQLTFESQGKDVHLPLGFRLAKKLAFNKVKAALGLDECKMCCTGAAPITLDTLEFFGSLGIQINEVYGMSESTGMTTLSTNQIHRWGSCGFAAHGSEVKVFRVDEKDINVKKECPTVTDPTAPTEEEQGEICFRGRGIMNGYLANPRYGSDHMAEIKKKNDEAVDAEGWMHSGDKGTLDELGMLRITGRYKELIIGAGGENIAPVPMEDQIKKNAPAISNVMMVGDKRKFNTAVVTLKAKGATGELPGGDELTGPALDVNPQVTTVSAAQKDPVWLKYVEDAIRAANLSPACPSNAAKIQKFRILSRDFSVETDEFTPTLKLKRSVTCKIHIAAIEEMYAESE